MSENNNLIKCECGKEFRGNFCPICGKRAVPVQRPVQQPITQQPVQKPVQQPITQQPVQRPVQQPITQQPVQRPVQQPITQQPVQRPVQQPITQQPVQRPVQQPITQQPVQKPVQQPITQQPVQRPVQQPVQRPVQQPTVPAYQYQEQQNAAAVNVNTSKKLDFMTVWNLILDYRISVSAPIAALIAFASGYVFIGLTAIIFGICALPQVKAKFVGRKVLYYIIWAACLFLFIISVGIESGQESEDDYDYNYNYNHNDYSHTDTNGMYVLGDTVYCGDWSVRIDRVEVGSVLGVTVTCTATIENTSGYDKKFVSGELFVLDNNGVSDTPYSMDDYNTISSGSTFTTEIVFSFSEHANKDFNNMTLNAGENTIYFYS